MSVVAAASSTPWINFSALWRILVVGLLAGAGLPALFAVGLRTLNHRPGAPAGPGDAHVYGGSRAGLAGGIVCFALVLAAVGWGIDFIVSAG